MNPQKFVKSLVKVTASLTDTVYNAEKLTATAYAYDAATGQFQWDAIKAEDISDVPTDIDLKTGKLKTGTSTEDPATTPKTANAALSALPTWSWFLIVPAVGYLGYLAVKAIFKKNKKKVVSK